MNGRTFTLSQLAIAVIGAAVVAGGVVYAFAADGLDSGGLLGFAGAPPPPDPRFTITDIGVDQQGRVHVVDGANAVKTYSPDGKLLSELPPRIVDDDDAGWGSAAETKTEVTSNGMVLRKAHCLGDRPCGCAVKIDVFDSGGGLLGGVEARPLDVLPDAVEDYRLKDVAAGADGVYFAGIEFPGGSAVVRIDENALDGGLNRIDLFAIDQTINR